VGARLTTRSRLRPCRSPMALGPPCSPGATSPRRFRPRAEADDQPLTLPFASRSRAGKPADPGTLGPELSRVRQDAKWPRPEAPSLDRCPLPARISPRRSEPATVPAVLPPPGRLPTPVRSPAARAGRARPTGGFRRDGEGQTPPVDFCNRYDPRARPRDPPNPVHPDCGRPRSRFVSRPPCGYGGAYGSAMH
jgi:hypothetical protein